MTTNWKNWGVALIAALAMPCASAAYDNSPTNQQFLPEVIWAPATGGGTWVTEVQIIDKTGGSQISVSFYYGAGNVRGPFPIWTGTGAYHSAKYGNILEYIQTNFDPGFAYSGKVGALAFTTQSASYRIWVTARTLNGNYSKTFPGLNGYDSNTALVGRNMIITNLIQNAAYRSTAGFFNPTAQPITVKFILTGPGNSAIGSNFDKTIGAGEFTAFFPFTEAGVPSGTYENAWLFVWPQSGSGRIFCFGATANNYTNDPAAHIAVQFQ